MHSSKSDLLIGAVTVVPALAALVLVTSGCSGAHEVFYGADQVITREPPEPRVEDIPDPPFGDAVWIAGHWSWTGRRYVWLSGRHVRRPAPGLFWYQGGYVVRGDGYMYLAGRWGPLGYRPPFRYHHRHRYPGSGGGFYTEPGAGQ